MTEDFEIYWRKNSQTILQNNAEYQKAAKRNKQVSGADMLLIAIPAVAGIASFDYITLESELLKWLVSALITIACYVACVYIKSVTTVADTTYDVEKKVKQAEKERWEKENGADLHTQRTGKGI